MEKAMESSMNNKAFGAILNQIGLFNVLPMIVENSLEDSFLPAIEDFLTMQLQHPSVCYKFSLGTCDHFFGRTILLGCATQELHGKLLALCS
ncbi:hypothetical protein GIB67_033457 [Kingdonia uniflora]|uniref:Uncharacterized protein n=1 Tax=Kingdonia uniflora TaxID=39325 RepID=A0A7J7LU68_9MAGN|nr:hypothetical protein GIB67_033457 [Kingdonia uniflora]